MTPENHIGRNRLGSILCDGRAFGFFVSSSMTQAGLSRSVNGGILLLNTFGTGPPMRHCIMFRSRQGRTKSHCMISSSTAKGAVFLTLFFFPEAFIAARICPGIVSSTSYSTYFSAFLFFRSESASMGMLSIRGLNEIGE